MVSACLARIHATYLRLVLNILIVSYVIKDPIDLTCACYMWSCSGTFLLADVNFHLKCTKETKKLIDVTLLSLAIIIYGYISIRFKAAQSQIKTAGQLFS